MNDLEQALRGLDVEWPATPDLAAAVSARLDTAPPRRRALPSFSAGWRARLAAVAAVLALLAGGTLAASPEARSTVLRWLGLESVEIERGTPSATPGPRSTLGRTLGLGTPVTLEAARRERLVVRVPEALGDPDAVYITTLPEGTRAASLVYAPRDDLPASGVSGVGLLVQSFPASATPFIEKTIHSGAVLERLTVDGAQAYWITQAHGFAFSSARGTGYEDQRLADRTLLVEGDGVLLRIEGKISRERAVEIAKSIQ